MPSNSPLKGSLPGYAWDTRMQGGRYRLVNADGGLGRLVSEGEIADSLREMYERTQTQFGGLAQAVARGDITPSLFQRAMMEQLKNLHLSTAVLGAGGWDRADARLYGRVGRVLRDEYRYLARFVRQMEAGQISPAEAVNRAQLYADNAYGQYWRETDRRMSRANVNEERLITDLEPCEICVDAAAQGWVKLGTHTIPKHLKCRCHKEYRTDDE